MRAAGVFLFYNYDVRYFQILLSSWDTLVDGEGIVLQLVAQLRLEVAQLFLQHVHAHDGNVLGLQRSCGLDDQKELVGFAVVVIRRLNRKVIVRNYGNMRMSKFNDLRLVLVELGIFRLGPLLRLRKQRVAECVVRVVLKSDPGRWVPFGVLFGKSLLRVGFNLRRVTT